MDQEGGNGELTNQDNTKIKIKDSEYMNIANIPKDNNKFVYFVFCYLGLTVAFPYNMLISVNDYWNYKFRNTSVPSNATSYELTDLQKAFPGYLALSGHFPLAVLVVLTALFGWIISLRTRVIFTATLMAITIGVIVILASISTDSWQKTLFNIILVITTIYASLNAVYQASFLGNLGRFPARYIGFTHVGIGLGQVLPSLINITVLGTNLPLQTTSIFCLSLGMLVMLLAAPLYSVSYKTSFYQHHSGQATNASHPKWTDFLMVLNTSWLLVCSVFLSYGTSISVFPALAALVKPVSQEQTAWNQTFFVPVCCFLVFTTCDWLGRVIATATQWPRPGLASEVGVAMGVLVRIGFIPLIMMCNLAPLNRNSQVLIHSDTAYILLLVLFGLLGGYLGNVSLMLGQKKVKREQQEAAGHLMTAMLVAGLGVGAGIGPALVSLL